MTKGLKATGERQKEHTVCHLPFAKQSKVGKQAMKTEIIRDKKGRIIEVRQTGEIEEYIAYDEENEE